MHILFVGAVVQELSQKRCFVSPAALQFLLFPEGTVLLRIKICFLCSNVIKSDFWSNWGKPCLWLYVKVWMAKGHVSGAMWHLCFGHSVVCFMQNITDFWFIRWEFDLLVRQLKLSWFFCDSNLFSYFYWWKQTVLYWWAGISISGICFRWTLHFGVAEVVFHWCYIWMSVAILAQVLGRLNPFPVRTQRRGASASMWKPRKRITDLFHCRSWAKHPHV